MHVVVGMKRNVPVCYDNIFGLFKRNDTAKIMLQG